MCKALQDWREYRRFRAFELHQQGWSGTNISQALGVSKGAVSRWLTRARQGGREALRRAQVPGRRPKLPPEELARLPELLAKGAEAYGFRGEVWTCQRVARVIEREFSVSYSAAHASRLLKGIAWTPQRPVVKATQRNEAAITRWRKEYWPEIKKSPAGSQNRRLCGRGCPLSAAQRGTHLRPVWLHAGAYRPPVT